ncbi:MAG: hypothetical protein GF334_05425 [Candidatus Altiarchaeales archaeon]|nr:hypothetical protein [Candidatus Altiarchaeales archaeon]
MSTLSVITSFIQVALLPIREFFSRMGDRMIDAKEGLKTSIAIFVLVVVGAVAFCFLGWILAGLWAYVSIDLVSLVISTYSNGFDLLYVLMVTGLIQFFLGWGAFHFIVRKFAPWCAVTYERAMLLTTLKRGGYFKVIIKKTKNAEEETYIIRIHDVQSPDAISVEIMASEYPLKYLTDTVKVRDLDYFLDKKYEHIPEHELPLYVWYPHTTESYRKAIAGES